jgi:formate dehydrogenase alpha subunit
VNTVRLTIDGKEVQVEQGSTVLEAVRALGLYVPTLCFDEDMKPFGACRLCIVQIQGMRGLPLSCATPASEGMVVQTETEEIRKVRRAIVEMAIADHPYECLVCDKSEDCELLKVARYVGVDKDRIKRLRRGMQTRPIDTSHPAYDRDLNKCILCGKCVRACDEIQVTNAIDFIHRGYKTLIAPFGGKPVAQSNCVSCGECIERCPTGALMPKNFIAPQREVKTICPYCGVGCSIYLGVRGNDIVRVKGDKESEVNKGGLCVKGRFGFDYVNHPDRLTKPLIRREGVPKSLDNQDFSKVFREATWEEALEKVVQGIGRIRDQHGPDSLAVLASAKCTNEDNYVIQKFARAALGTNNVDHCARLCHASTVAAALMAFGDGAMSNSFSDIDKAELIFVIGSNTTECHPIVGRRIKQAVKFKGVKLMVADPRDIELGQFADIQLNQKPGSDVALLNAIMYQIVHEGLADKAFIENRCEDFEPFLQSLEEYAPETVEETTGVSAEKIREAARLFGRAKRAIVFYGMGITQHTTGVDNVKAIANLLLLTGNMGRPGTGFAPLRGQNNVQGSCDMGALPVVYPGYQRVDNPAVKAKFEEAWGRKLSDRVGLALTEMIDAAYEGRIKAMYVMGENPMLSDPDLNHAREAVSRLDFLAVQDIFLTETAQLADVVLPTASFAEKDGTFTNTERRVQLVRKAIDAPGEAREDWRIVAEISSRLGYPMSYASSAEIMAEIAQVAPIYGGMHHDRLDNGGLQWPCWNRKHKGTPMLHKGAFTRGKGKFHVVHYKPPAELPSSEYPLVLTTGRILEHYHTGTMSRRSRVLETLVPESHMEISPADAALLGVKEGEVITVASRRGKVETKVRKTRRVGPGLAFMAFHWKEAPANMLTNAAFDPIAKIPEFKVSAVKAAAGYKKSRKET